MCVISSFSQTSINQHNTNLGKSMRSPILVRFPCYSNSFITTFEEENVGSQAQRDYDFAAPTVKLGFRGRKWWITGGLGGSIHIDVYFCVQTPIPCSPNEESRPTSKSRLPKSTPGALKPPGQARLADGDGPPHRRRCASGGLDPRESTSGLQELGPGVLLVLCRCFLG